MIIAVPSKGRAGRTTTDRVLPNATFFVPESEAHQYEGLYKNVVAVPKSIIGITPTRNWILKQYKGEDVVFVDDDVKSCGYTKMYSRKTKQIMITDENFWMNEFNRFFELTYQLGYKIWGVKTDSASRSLHPDKPFLFRTYVTASCMGIINDGEFMFDENYIVKEDYEICLRHIIKKGGILGVRYLHWENKHWDNEGGCKDYRTVEIEAQAIRQLARDYPGYVIKANRKNNVFTIKLNL